MFLNSISPTYYNTMIQPANYYTPNQSGTAMFNSGSTYNDLANALNSANAAPGSDQFNQIVGQYNTALGLTGQGAGNGFNYGQYDPTRTKIYEPGADLRYINSVDGKQVSGWQAHPWSSDSGSQSNGMNSMFPSWLSSFFNNMQQQQQRQNTLGWRQQWAQRANQKPIYANSTTTPINRFGGY